MTEKVMDQIMDLISAKRLTLNQTDMREIYDLITQIPLDDLPDQYPWIFESLSIFVNSPEYEGDIPPID